MLLVITLMSELLGQKRERGWRILCVTWIQFLIIKNVCVGEYIFFLFWPWNHVFKKSRYLSTPPYIIYMYKQDLLWVWREWGTSIIRTNRDPPPTPRRSTQSHSQVSTWFCHGVALLHLIRTPHTLHTHVRSTSYIYKVFQLLLLWLFLIRMQAQALAQACLWPRPGTVDGPRPNKFGLHTSQWLVLKH